MSMCVCALVQMHTHAYLYQFVHSLFIFQGSLVVLALREGASVSILETVTLAVGLPFSLLWCLLGWIMVGQQQ